MRPITCETCRRDLHDVNSKKNMRNFTGYLGHTNVRLGEALRDTGWEVGPELLWKTKRCCRPCVSVIQIWDTARTSLRLRNVAWRERTGHGLPTIQPVKLKQSSQSVRRKKIIRHIENSQYAKALPALRRMKAVQKAMLVDLKKTVRAEMRLLAKDKFLSSACSIDENPEESEWNNILDRIKSLAPTVYNAFYAAMSTSDIQNCRLKKALMKSRLGLMFLVALHHRKARSFHITRHVYLKLATLLFKIPMPHLQKSHKGKNGPSEESLQKEVEKARRLTARRIVKSWSTSIEKTSEATYTPLAGARRHPGYSLVINSRSSKSKYGVHTVCDAFAVKNRVSFRELKDDTIVKASDLPLKTYLPSQKDYEELRMRMRVLVERILKANLDMYSDQPTLEHIPHEYSKECSEKSEYGTVNLRIREGLDDPKDPKQMLKIMNRLSTLIPDDYDMPLHTDQETISLLVDSARTMASKNPSFSKLYPVPQDLRAAVVKDTISDLFTPTEATEEGTLRHLKELFNHEDVDEEVSSFHSAADFLLFIACAFVVGFAKEILWKPRYRSKPKLDKIADEIVRRIWHQLPMNRVTDILDAPVDDHDDQFCFCKKYKGGAVMVECCNIDCPHGRWFHQSCVMNVQPEGEWFCSSQCAQSNMGLFCICRQKGEVGTDLTLSCANKYCQRGEHFHYQCVRSASPVQDDRKWCCSVECAKGKAKYKERDELLEYLQRVTWCSLFSECIRDAEREGDGLASIAYWRISMPELFARGHEQHVADTHRLLAGTSGCFPVRIGEEVIHNRTINLQGGQGKNVSLNFLTEQKNSVKEGPSSTQGKEGSRSKQRRVESSRNLEDSAQRFSRYQEDVIQFLYNFGDMFSEKKGRVIPSLHQKIVGQEITQKQASEIKESLLKLNKKFDDEMQYHRSDADVPVIVNGQWSVHYK